MKTLFIAGIAAAALALAGCGGGGDPAEPPKYDLTGIWDMASPVDCGGTYLTEDQWNDVERDIEATSARVTQTGNTLEIVWLDTGQQITGTLSDDQIHYGEDTTFDFLGLDCSEETDGTTLSADLVTWTTTIQCSGPGVRVSATCAGDMRRR